MKSIVSNDSLNLEYSDKERYRGVDNLIIIAHGNIENGTMFNPNNPFIGPNKMQGSLYLSLSKKQSAHINVVDFCSCYSGYTGGDDICPAEGVVKYCDVDASYGYAGIALNPVPVLFEHYNVHYKSNCDGYYCFERTTVQDPNVAEACIPFRTRLEPDLILPDVNIDDVSPEISYYYTMIHSRASAGEQ